MKPSSSRSLSTCELISGNSDIAIEHALIKNGNRDKVGCYAFISFLKAIREVAFISSEKVKAGIDRDSVIVLVIAFFIPVMRFTLKDKRDQRFEFTSFQIARHTYVSSSVIPVNGAILGPLTVTVSAGCVAG